MADLEGWTHFAAGHCARGRLKGISDVLADELWKALAQTIGGSPQKKIGTTDDWRENPRVPRNGPAGAAPADVFRFLPARLSRDSRPKGIFFTMITLPLATGLMPRAT